MILGSVDDTGRVQIAWGPPDRLDAPGEQGNHYLPCRVCGEVKVVTGDVAEFTCWQCFKVRGWALLLNGEYVEDPVELVRGLPWPWRLDALMLQTGSCLRVPCENAEMVVERVK